MALTTVAVFCGSSFGNNPAYRQGAERLGREIGKRKLSLVYGGSALGLMGSVARCAMEEGAPVTGVIPEALNRRVEALDGITLEVVSGMHQRKARMYQLADAFISLPGGIGTWEETLEALTWLQLGYHRKPVALYNLENFYNPMVSLLDHAVGSGFLKETHRQALIVESELKELFSRLETFTFVQEEKW
jgi:uncharacterized protein (TIGR00730 family)